MNSGFTSLKGYWIAAMAMAALLACNPGGTEQAGGMHSDLNKYFADQLVLIRQGGLQLRKTVSMNGRQDSIALSAPDSAQLQDLLKPFLDVDINKPSLRNAYDTAAITDQFTGRRSVMYTARNKSVNPQQIILNMDEQGNIATVNINKRTRNLVYEYQQTLFYQHLRNIQITTYQKIAFLQPSELDVKVLLEPKNHTRQ